MVCISGARQNARKETAVNGEAQGRVGDSGTRTDDQNATTLQRGLQTTHDKGSIGWSVPPASKVTKYIQPLT